MSITSSIGRMPSIRRSLWHQSADRISNRLLVISPGRGLQNAAPHGRIPLPLWGTGAPPANMAGALMTGAGALAPLPPARETPLSRHFCGQSPGGIKKCRAPNGAKPSPAPRAAGPSTDGAAPPTAQARGPAYGVPIGAKKFLFPPFFTDVPRFPSKSGLMNKHIALRIWV